MRRYGADVPVLAEVEQDLGLISGGKVADTWRIDLIKLFDCKYYSATVLIFLMQAYKSFAKVNLGYGNRVLFFVDFFQLPA
jgi:hypothetical protein